MTPCELGRHVACTSFNWLPLLTDDLLPQVLYSPPTGGRRLLQDATAPAPAATGTPACAVNLANATTLASIITIAQQSAPTLPDEATRAALIQTLTPEQIAAVGAAVSALNTWVDAAPDATTTETAQYYAEATVCPVLQAPSFGVCLVHFDI